MNGVNRIFYGASREVGNDLVLTYFSKFYGGILTMLGIGAQYGAAYKHYNTTIEDPDIRSEAMLLETGNIAVGYAGAWGGAKLGAYIGFAIGGPVGAIIGGAIGFIIADVIYDEGVKRYYGS